MANITKFITEELLQSTLKHYLNTEVDILSIRTSNLLESNKNFCSTLLRLIVTYSNGKRHENEELSLVAKIFPEDEEVAKITVAMKAFDNELGVYGEILPRIDSLDYREKMSPKAIYVSSNPKPTLILEDLDHLGYKMFSHPEGLDVEHCLLVVKKLAYFHAASVAVNEKNPDLISKYKYGMFSNSTLAEKFLSICIPSLLEVCSSFPDLGQYVNKVSYEKIIQKLTSSFITPKKFNVLNHGDPRTNNCMFYYNSNGKLIDVTLIDFQFPIFDTPAQDLHYLWALNTTLDTKMGGPDNILVYYHKKLDKNLQKLKVRSTPPTFEELKRDFSTAAIHGFVASIITLPLSFNEKRVDATLSNFFSCDDETGYRFSSFHNESYIQHLKLLLPLYDELGTFD